MASMSAPPPLLRPEHAALLEEGVSITAGGRDAHLRPCLARTFGARISDDLRKGTVFLSHRQARPCSALPLEDLAAIAPRLVAAESPISAPGSGA